MAGARKQGFGKERLKGKNGTEIRIRLFPHQCQITVDTRGGRKETLIANEDTIHEILGGLAESHGVPAATVSKSARDIQHRLRDYWKNKALEHFTYDSEEFEDEEYDRDDIAVYTPGIFKKKLAFRELDRFHKLDWLIQRARRCKSATDFESKFSFIVRQYRRPVIEAKNNERVGIYQSEGQDLIWAMVMEVTPTKARVSPLRDPKRTKWLASIEVTPDLSWFFIIGAVPDEMQIRLFWYISKFNRLV